MGGFMCPKCKAVRHIDESDDDPRLDVCWKCGTRVPYTEAEIADFRATAAEDNIWPGLLRHSPLADPARAPTNGPAGRGAA